LAAALDGVVVVEMATGVSGPYCGKLLALLGAEVVKIEPPGGDPSRQKGPFPADTPDPERSGLFLHLNTGKRSLVLDVADPVQRAERDALIEAADVLLLSHRPSQLTAAGLNPADHQRRCPSLVVVDVTLCGLSGPYAEYRGSEIVAYAISGYMSLTGAAEREPIKAYGHLVEYQAGTHAALGTLAALAARDRDGLGQLVDVSTVQAGTFLLGTVQQRAHFYGEVVKRNGTRLLGFPPQHSYPSTIRPCADGYVHCHSNNRHRDMLGALIPHPRLLAPDLLAEMMGHADEIDAIMDDWLKDRRRAEVVELAQELRLPFTEVLTPGEAMSDRHNVARGSFITVDHPGARKVTQPGPPFRMSATPLRLEPAPGLGQDAGYRPPGRASTLPAAAEAPDQRSLAGIRVIDFTVAVAGPIATSLLADLGAEVIKVEAPNGRPLHAAGVSPAGPGGEIPTYDRIMAFNELNHGKRGISLDVGQPDGRDLFARLVAASDVIVQNFAPRVMSNLGIDYEALRAIRPGLIMASMPAFGLDGPYRDRLSYGPGIDAMSGLSHLTGYPDGPPMKPGNFLCDQNAGVLAAVAVVAALRHRGRTGEGQHIELAMIEGELQLLGDAYIDFAMNGRNRQRCGNDHPAMAPHGLFPCRGEDSWIAIAIEDDEQWHALCATIGEPAAASDPRFATAGRRKANNELVVKMIGRWSCSQDAVRAEKLLQHAGVSAGAVRTTADLLDSAHLQATRAFHMVEAWADRPAPYVRAAYTLSRTAVHDVSSAPRFAEANRYVFQHLLGVDDATLSDLETRQIVTATPVAPP
jgi:crotonobetainyl-CoA:carnitine CoA-transferase CaiB-like acyl-CoA transferase